MLKPEKKHDKRSLRQPKASGLGKRMKGGTKPKAEAKKLQQIGENFWLNLSDLRMSALVVGRQQLGIKIVSSHVLE